MGEKWEKLKSILNSIIMLVPEEIKSECDKLFPSDTRMLTFGEKMNIYSFSGKLHQHVPKNNKYLIGKLLDSVDELSA